MTQSGLFEYLEQDLAGETSPHWTPDPVVLASELATADWTDDEAAGEIARVASHDEALRAYCAVVTSLARNPAVDIRGIRMARILRRAMDALRPTTPLPPMTPPRKRRRWLWST